MFIKVEFRSKLLKQIAINLLLSVLVMGVIENCMYSKIDSFGNQRCTYCMKNYQTSDDYYRCSLCDENITKCQRCHIINDSVICESCVSEYTLVNKECIPINNCSNPYCFSCSSPGSSICYSCKKGNKYNLTTYTCSPCEVKGSYEKKILGVCQCPNYTYLEIAQNGSWCAPCDRLCFSCLGSPDNCIFCIWGYYKKNGFCVPCPEDNCNCDDSSKCYDCNYGFKLIGGKCIPSMNEHSSLAFYQSLGYLAPEIYFFCEPGCFHCSQFDFCQNCLSGYYYNLYALNCTPCIEGCKHCQYFNNEGCVLCLEGLQLFDGKCVTCNDLYCVNCNQNLSICRQCKKGYTVYNETCVACADNCLQCNDEGEATCDQRMCAEGFTRISLKECVQCALGCSVCSSVDITQCISCPIGLYQVVGGHCQICPEGCLSCFSLTYCYVCRIGYRLFDLMCYIDGQYPCIQTSPYSKACTKCAEGYKWSQDFKCKPDLSCNLYRQCLICPNGYYLPYPNQICNQCQDKQNCIKCNMYPDRCSVCAVGYYISKNKCYKCNENCTSCQLQNHCFGCKTGFYLKKQLASDGVCLSCSQKCLTCIDQAYKCNSCYPGMKLMGYSCISLQIILFQIKMQHKSISISSGEKVAFIKEIVKFTKIVADSIGPPFSSNPSLLLLKQISEGSITLSYMTSIENMDSLHLLQLISIGLSKLENVGDFTILESKIVRDGFIESTIIELSNIYYFISFIPAPFFIIFMFFMMKACIQRQQTKKIYKQKIFSIFKDLKKPHGVELDLKPMQTEKNLYGDIMGAISL